MNSCDIDLIKWMCDKAEGFETIEDMKEWYVLVANRRREFRSIKRVKHWFLYPFLLQRAIEGVDEIVRVSKFYIEIGDRDDPEYGRKVSDFDSIDQAKESALKYIYEQETK